MAVVKDLTGQRFGRLVVLKQDGKTNNGNAKWFCQCDCGNTKSIASYALRRGNTRSCGCLQSERSKTASITHGEAKTRLYKIWAGIKTRCYNQNQVYEYSKYGKRGIKMCEEWKNSYECFRDWAFTNGYKDNLTIDRIDYTGNYEPSNCRWATMKQQSNNRSSNHRLTFCGITKTVSEWSDITGLPNSTILHRIERGWNVQDTLLTPRQVTKNGKFVYVPSKITAGENEL